MAIDDRGSGAAQALQSSASVGGLNIERQNLTLRMSPRQWGITNSHDALSDACLPPTHRVHARGNRARTRQRQASAVAVAEPAARRRSDAAERRPRRRAIN